MICFHCGAQLTKQDVCLKCGTDVRLYKKILATSDHLYNEALIRAKKRDLTGAKDYLRQSLQLNKKNIPARNLLGLIFYETGDPAYAVREWVISQNYKENDNIATRYLADVEKEIHSINVSLKKYNQALDFLKTDSRDMALVALKQLMNRPYCMVKARQLLALMYMEENAYGKAEKLLTACKAIDVGDMTTVRYMEALNDKKIVARDGSYREAIVNAIESGDERNGVIIPENTREYSSYFMSALYVIIGLVLGAGIIYHMVIPSVKSNFQQTNTSNLENYERTISELRSQVTNDEAQIDRLEAQILALNEQVNNTEPVVIDQSYDVFLPVLTAYINDDVREMVQAISKLDAGVEDELYQNIYKRLLVDYKDSFGYRAFYRGNEYIDKSYYYEAMEQYKLAYQLLGENARIVYSIGLSYEMIGDYPMAMYYYEYAIRTYPDDVWVGDSKVRKEIILGQIPDMEIPEVKPGELEVTGLEDLWTPAASE